MPKPHPLRDALLQALSFYPPDRWISGKELRGKIPGQRTMHTIINTLSHMAKIGLVESQKGRGGGYRLPRNKPRGERVVNPLRPTLPPGTVMATSYKVDETSPLEPIGEWDDCFSGRNISDLNE